MVLGLGEQFEDPRFSAQQAINLQRRELGQERLGVDDPSVQSAQQFSDFQTQAQPLVAQAEAGARTRAENTFQQIRQAGLAGLANQFQRSQRDIAFETARRGTLGGSRSIEREQGARAQAESGIGGVLTQASQQAESQRLQELAPVFGFQQQSAQGDPLAQVGLQNQLAGIQQEGQAAQGQFDIGQQLEAIRSGSALNRAQFLGGAISNIGTGIAGSIDARSRERQLGAAQTAANRANPGFVGPLPPQQFTGPQPPSDFRF